MECPYCHEEVKEAAVVCGHCGRDLSAFKLIAPTLEKVSDFEERLSSLEKQLSSPVTRAICNADGPRGIMHRMNAYSEDLRKKILEALSRGTTKSEAARTFGVSRSSVKRYAKLAEQGLPLAPKKRPGSKPKMDESATKLLETDLERHPTATLAERREFLKKVAGVRVSESTISRMLRRLGWSRKKGRWVRARETSS